MITTRHRVASSVLAMSAVCVFAIFPTSAATPRARYDIPAEPLTKALIEVGRVAGRQILFPGEQMNGLVSPALHDELSPEEALARLLHGTPFTVDSTREAIFIRGRSEAANAQIGDAASASQIIVTGTRIKGQHPIGAAITEITREDLLRSGYATADEILKTLPQNFGGGGNAGTTGLTAGSDAGFNSARGSSVNLRGLGTSSTLVLLDGNRPPLGGFSGTFADISLIPAAAIDRIEVLADGASAIYGSDAVAGVVNIIPRKNFTGAESSIRYGSADGDFDEFDASQIVGISWTGGRVMAAYEYYHTGALAASDRPYVTDNLQAYGGPDNRVAYATPGTIFAGGQSFAIPSGQNGHALTAADLTAGTTNLGDRWRLADVLPDQSRHSVYAAASQELGSDVSLYAAGLFSDRQFSARTRPISNARRVVPVTNPFYVDPPGTGQPVSVQYDFADDLGPERASGYARQFGTTFGAQATIGGWEFDAHGNYGRQSEYGRRDNLVNSARLAVALADTNPATSYNLFGDGDDNNPETIDYVRGSTASKWHYNLWSANVKADGSIIRLPGGMVKVAIGSEYRVETFGADPDVSDRSSLAPTYSPYDDLPGPRRISAVYGELLVPIFGKDNAIPAFRSLLASVAGRFEHYNDFGNTTNPKIGLSWEPAAGVTIRSSLGTSFRAPGFNSLRQGSFNYYYADSLADPSSPTGMTNVLVLQGNLPHIKPEKANTWTAGIDVNPMFARNLRANATYFSVNYRDRIVDPSVYVDTAFLNRHAYQSLIVPNASAAEISSYYSSPYFDDFAGINPTTINTIIDSRVQNLSRVKQTGIDFDLSYRLPIGRNSVEIGGSGTYLFQIRQAFTPTSTPVDVVNTLGNPTSLRLRARVLGTFGPLDVSGFVNYVGAYRNENVLPVEHVSSWTTIDFQLAYRFSRPDGRPDGWTMALSATNLFDRAPPYVNNNTGVSTIGFDPENANAVGRMISFQITKRW